MGKSNNSGLMIIVIILAVLLVGGTESTSKGGSLFSPTPKTPAQQQADIQRQITDTKYKVDELKKQVAIEEAKKTQSRYKNIVDLYFINHSSDPSKEYISIHVNSTATTSIKITGWTLKSLSSGVSVKIPQASYLFFANSINSEQDIYLSANETLYLITGISPNGASFKVNKCSGYLNQFQTFIPYIGGYCPAPRNENLSSIPKTVYNDSCFDFINSMPSCRIQTNPLPASSQKWSAECIDFIYKKINYPACVDTHKNDQDFYQKDWRVYLKRSEHLWKNTREDVVLLDEYGKIVDEIKY
ncbi:MAG: hypothetical protein AB201_02565 [Parcubacteria bacterium C7867-006]|nr:MAG: hypothetical protein AB201_02565 [Parcubacteria bacterium C7867-006]